MSDENWVDGMRHHPPSPWKAIGWVAFTICVGIAPAAVLAGWRWLL